MMHVLHLWRGRSVAELSALTLSFQLPAEKVLQGSYFAQRRVALFWFEWLQFAGVVDDGVQL